MLGSILAVDTSDQLETKSDMKLKVAPVLIPLTRNRLFQSMVFILLFLLIVFVAREVGFIFNPVVVLLSTLFLPVLLAGIFYYLFSPLVRIMSRKKIPNIVGILVVYSVLVMLLVLAVVIAIPILKVQIESLITNGPRLIDNLKISIEEYGRSYFISRFLPEVSDITEELPARAAELVTSLYTGIIRNFTGFFGFIANLLIALATVPFILFFMLKDGYKLPSSIARFFPDKHKEEATMIVRSMGATLELYIQGQLLVSLFVGVMLLIGYIILGIEFALLLAIVALVTNLIPYIGPIIGTLPGLIVALTHGPGKMLQVLILAIIVQQVESQLISPLVMGTRLRIHPLIIIFLLLTAGSLAGFFGLLLAVPAFAVGRTAVTHLYHLVLLKKKASAVGL